MAEPPAGADPSLAPWFQSLKVPENGTNAAGLSCCDVSDCRPASYRISKDHYEVFVDRKTFGMTAPDGWVQVPNEVVITRRDNPTGDGVVCYYQGAVRCFVPASGT